MAPQRDFDPWLSRYTKTVGAHDGVAGENEYLRRLFDHAPVAYFVTDGSLTILDANREAQRLWGVPVSRLKGKPLALLIAQSDRRAFRQIVEEILREPEPVMRPIRLHPSRGNDIEVFFTARAQRNAAGDPEAVYCVFSTSSQTESSDIM